MLDMYINSVDKLNQKSTALATAGHGFDSQETQDLNTTSVT